MLWWDWTASRKLALVATMLPVAALPWLILGSLPRHWGAFLGGTAFLMLPLMFGWALFVGLVTGRIPARGSETRSVSPRWFWIVAATYAGLMILIGFMIISVVTG